MTRKALIFLTLLILQLGCTTEVLKMGADGKPLPSVYRINVADSIKIQFRVLDSINAIRKANGVQTLQLDSKLNAAAKTHSRDMSVQNRAWHFGSDGSSPLDRVRRFNYSGILVGENISETYETELETLAAWVKQKDTRNVLLSSKARKLGFGYFQEPNGKIWWTLVTGS
tara:strand:- start:236 stop:745 length:510 start_codon:yes stop_codon:yes gene_type:complete